MWSDLKTPLVIGHRGDSAHAPENTLSAFRMAADKGADAVEFDVKLTADLRVIALHDQTVDRTTNGHGQVSKMTFAELRNLHAGARFDGKFPGERIPTLDEIFEEVGTRLHMNVELTNYATPGDPLVEKVVEVVRRHNIQKQLFFSSFDARNLRQVHSLLPDVPRGLLARELWRGWKTRLYEWKEATFEALNPFFMDTTRILVKRVHSSGKGVNVWTVNGEAEMKRLISIGVDGIITNDPALLLGLLSREK